MIERLRVLFVDDDEGVRRVARYVFGDRFELDTAASGADALELLQARHYDALLTDQRMPGMTGVELCERVADRYPRMRRVILTAYADLEAAEAAINRGRVNGWLRKPFDEEALTRALARHEPQRRAVVERESRATAVLSRELDDIRMRRKSWDPREERH